MRRVELNMDENLKYATIKKLVETKGNKNTASVRLSCTLRNINRMINGYVKNGKEYFVHGNRGRKPFHTIPFETKQTIIDLYKNKYFDANFTHYTELLGEHENIYTSVSAVNRILMSENILSPKATRATKKRVKNDLIARQENTSLSDAEKKHIAETIIAIEDAHPRRPRCAYVGEIIQMDASLHNWFGNYTSQLHIGIDDSTGSIVAAYFDLEETLKGYYNVLNSILVNHGIPYMFLTDRRTVFEYKKKKAPSIEEDTFTQFGYACNQLGIQIKTTSVPQAKGRVERLFQTLQSRLTLELRLAGVTTIEHANEFLNSYIKKFNAKFALPIDHSKSVFEKQPENSEINLILAVLTNRKIDDGHCIRFNKKYYKPVDAYNNPVYHRKGTDALVIKSFDGELYTSINYKTYGLEEVAINEISSKNFDILKDEQKQDKKYIPPMNHPWKQSSFMNFLKKQSHLKDKIS